MHLDYLLFDTSDEASGRAGFDAMACVTPGHLAPLLAEVAGVLRWAHASFGSPGAPEEAEWDFELQATAQHAQPLDIAFDEDTGVVSLADVGDTARVTVTLTVSGSPAFSEAFEEAFTF